MNTMNIMVYALVMTLTNGQSFVVQKDISAYQCLQQLTLINNKINEAIRERGRDTESFRVDRKLANITVYTNNPTYECHLIGMKRG